MKTKKDHPKHNYGYDKSGISVGKSKRGSIYDCITDDPTSKCGKKGCDKHAEQIELVSHADKKTTHRKSDDPYVLSYFKHCFSASTIAFFSRSLILFSKDSIVSCSLRINSFCKMIFPSSYSSLT